jgi:hypothetical protein
MTTLLVFLLLSSSSPFTIQHSAFSIHHSPFTSNTTAIIIIIVILQKMSMTFTSQ